jgi:ABC-type Fe3+-hydroxamate transport system substrate-binding protein
MRITDQLGRLVHIKEHPERIISLVPSQTELLADLGLEKKVVGITKFCMHPIEWKKKKTIVGGTKNLRMEVIRSLDPDLIIANKEENNRDDILVLSGNYPVWVSDVKDIGTALEMIQHVGTITGHKEEAEKISIAIEQEAGKPLPMRGTAVYLIWKDPFMAAGSDTFIHRMLQQAGFENMIDKARYPEITMDEILQLQPGYLLLSSEPYPFNEKHVEELSEKLPHTKVLRVDGKMFSWYGSRLLGSWDYFRSI